MAFSILIPSNWGVSTLHAIDTPLQITANRAHLISGRKTSTDQKFGTSGPQVQWCDHHRHETWGVNEHRRRRAPRVTKCRKREGGVLVLAYKEVIYFWQRYEINDYNSCYTL